MSACVSANYHWAKLRGNFSISLFLFSKVRRGSSPSKIEIQFILDGIDNEKTRNQAFELTEETEPYIDAKQDLVPFITSPPCSDKSILIKVSNALHLRVSKIV